MSEAESRALITRCMCSGAAGRARGGAGAARVRAGWRGAGGVVTRN